MKGSYVFGLLSFLYSTLIYCDEILTEKYDVVFGIKLQNPYKTIVLRRELTALCAFECLKEKGICNSANYNGFSKCELNMHSPLHEFVKIIEDTNWRILYVKNGEHQSCQPKRCCDEGVTGNSCNDRNYQTNTTNQTKPNPKNKTYKTWDLVFRGTSEIGTELYPYYTGSVQPSSSPEVGCFFTHTLTCTTHYRNHGVFNNWKSQNIQEVKVAMYKNNVTVVELVFTNSVNDSYMDWFRKDNLLSSSYTDMTDPSQTFNYFSILGDGMGVRRRFYINRNYNGCPIDYGWVAVIDFGSSCSYESSLQVPSFAYIPGSTGGVWDQGFETADVFAIFIQR